MSTFFQTATDCLSEKSGCNRRHSTAGRTAHLFASILVISAVLVPTLGFAQDRYELAVESEFLRLLEAPGEGNNLLRPENVHVDRRAGEVFVSDPGNNRIVVFDTSGVFLFDFGGKDVFRNTGELVVDSRGYIFVLGSTPEGRQLYQFDYDGLLLGELQISCAPEGFQFEPLSISISENDFIYVVNGSDPSIVKIDTDGKFHSKFAVLSDLTEKLRKEAILGQPEIDANRLYLPVPSVGSVYVYDLDGEFELSFGLRGNLVGELNFPIDVTILDHKIVAVLDKHRFAVVCFSTSGQFLGEFGGMGVKPGKFYHPGYIDHDDQQRVYISQRFMNRVQVCEIPDIITERSNSFGGTLKGESVSDSAHESPPASLQPQLPNTLPEEVVLKRSLIPYSRSSFIFVSKSRRFN